MFKLTTYRRDQFANLKAELEKDGYTYVSAMELNSTQKLISLRGKGPATVDVSPLLPLLNPSNCHADIASITEVLIQLLDDALFIADEDAAAGHEYDMRTLFDEIEKSDIEGEPTTEEKQEKPQARRLTALNDEEAGKLLDDFDRKLIGQVPFKQALRKQVEIFRLFSSIGEQPILSMFLLGPSGVGKTESARILSELLAPGQPLPKINFGNYSSKDSLNSLIGSPRGYIGSEEGELPMKIRSSESGVILIDEFEKADPAVWNFFLDLLENGHFTDSQGTAHDLNGYAIVFTSNVPREDVIATFPPELISRFNLKAKFSALNIEEKRDFVRRYIESVAAKYQQIHGTLPRIGDAAKNALGEIDVTKEENVRILKNTAREWFANYIERTRHETIPAQYATCTKSIPPSCHRL